MKCQACKSTIPANSKFCKHCGLEIKVLKICPNPECGQSDLTKSAFFCPKCGTNLKTNRFNILKLKSISVISISCAIILIVSLIIYILHAKISANIQLQEKVFVSYTDSVSGFKFPMIAVKGGTFLMGYKGNSNYGIPKTVNDFYLGATEVTQGLWRSVMGKNSGFYKGDNFPVDNVDTLECKKFLRILNQKTGKKYMLPNDTEWEYAARGGISNHYYEFSGSNIINNVCWYKENSDNFTHKVGTKQSNELGFYDMSGNVMELCQGYGYFYRENSIGELIESYEKEFHLRGGDCTSNTTDCSVAYYTSNYTTNSSFKKQYIGFRIVLH